MTKQNIVVVGAGYAGVSATKYLAKKLKKEDVTITLIDRHSYHTMMTELHEVAGGRVEPEAIQYDLQHLFARQKNVQLVTDTVTGIDKEQKVVKTKLGTYPFDQLILGMGGEPNDFGTPGVKENGFTLWSFEDSVKIREHIERTVAKAALEPNDALRKAMLTFVVCGSGFTGIEMIGELIDWKKRLAKDYKLDPSEITLMVVEAMPTILNMLDRNDAAKAERYLKKHQVELLLNAPIVEVAKDHIKLKDGRQIPTHTLIWTAGVKGTSDAADFGLESARGQRLVANEYMQAKGYEDKNIYIIGDLVFYEEFPGTPTPQIVQAAEQTGHTAAATGAATSGAGEAATQATHFGLSYAYGEQPMAVIEKSPDWFTKMMQVIMPNNDVAMFFQKFMVFFEIALALALIAGLFTWLCSATTIWFIFVAFALMNGSGRAIGLDRWVIPWLQKTLGNWWYGRPKSRYGSK